MKKKILLIAGGCLTFFIGALTGYKIHSKANNLDYWKKKSISLGYELADLYSKYDDLILGRE